MMTMTMKMTTVEAVELSYLKLRSSFVEDAITTCNIFTVDVLEFFFCIYG